MGTYAKNTENEVAKNYIVDLYKDVCGSVLLLSAEKIEKQRE